MGGATGDQEELARQAERALQVSGPRAARPQLALHFAARGAQCRKCVVACRKNGYKGGSGGVVEAIPGRVPARRGPEIRGLAARRAGRHGRRGFAGGQAVRPCFRQDLLPARLLAAGWRVAAAPLCSEPARRLIPHAKKQTSGVPGWGAAAARLLACVEEWACFLALLGLSAAEKGREGTASAAEAGGIRACRVGQFPRRPICRVGQFPCRVGHTGVSRRPISGGPTRPLLC